jgi:hypothetical protein
LTAISAAEAGVAMPNATKPSVPSKIFFIVFPHIASDQKPEGIVGN